jgi:hypothetical protein
MERPDDEGGLEPRERERTRRRDRDLSAAARELMRTGQAKVFKQVLDRQARRAEAAGAGSSEREERAEPPGRDGHR